MSLKEYLVKVDSLSPHGGGLGKYELPSGKLKSFEALRTLPGETLRVMIGRRKKRGFQLARLVEILETSDKRIPPRCKHFSECGGCIWQHLSYNEQLIQKESYIKELLPSVDVLPIIGANEKWNYRNKMEFSFSSDLKGNTYLGLCIPNSRGRVVDMEECHLCSPRFMEVLDATRLFWEEENLKAFNQLKNEGVLKALMIREGTRTGDLLVTLVTSNEILSDGLKERFKEKLLKLDHPPSTILHLFQNARRGYQTTQSYQILFGSGSLSEELHITNDHHLKLKVSASSFFQPNTKQAELIYQKAFEMLGSLNGQTVFDLYSGTAIFGIIAARSAKQVYCIEQNTQSVKDARVNIEVNGIKNLELIEGDVEGELEKLNHQADLVIVDPPRGGLGKKTALLLINLNPQKILYVSCNPKTQAEDLKTLENGNYHIEKCQPIDQFPHTPHIENILVLKKRRP